MQKENGYAPHHPCFPFVTNYSNSYKKTTRRSHLLGLSLLESFVPFGLSIPSGS